MSNTTAQHENIVLAEVGGQPGQGAELALDPLPSRRTVALYFRILGGVTVDPPELTGIGSIVERTLSKGTQRFDGPGLADAFDRLGAQWSTATGRQSMLVRCLCLPEYTSDVVDLVAELLTEPRLADDACQVAVQLAQEELRHMEDDPSELLRVDMHHLTMGPVIGRDPSGDAESLPRITPELVREHWRNNYNVGRLQVTAAGPLDVDQFTAQCEKRFAGFGSVERDQRGPADFELQSGSNHRQKDLKQQYIAISMPGAARGSDDDPVERVLVAVLSGGMSGRLFTEVREKQGLVYWVGAWQEQPRGKGLLHMGASTTPERCKKTYDTLLRELQRLGEDLSAEETARARDGLLAHTQTEDDLTRARAMSLSDDLFHFGRPIGLQAKMERVRAVTVENVEEYITRMPTDVRCVTTVGAHDLAQD